MNAPRAWIVDLDGTLYRPMPVKFAMAMELLLLGPHRIRTLSRFRAMHERLRVQQRDALSVAQGESPWEMQLRLTAAELRTDVESIRLLVEDWMLRRPKKWIRLFRRRGLLREIGLFRDAGGQCALVSDYPALQKLQALGAVGLFRCVVANGEPGGPERLKPDPQGVLLAAEALGVEASRCLVLGDRIDADGAAAEAAGMAFRLIV